MKNHSTTSKFTNISGPAAPLILALLLSGISLGHAAPILWNRLGSDAQVLNSDLGPNLSFYGGGGWPDVIGNPGYVPGVFGNALTIAPGGYSIYEREHTVVWNNLDQYLSPERGTIDVWYKQNENPVAYSHGVYRIFDGSYGLGSGLTLDSETIPNTRLYFGLEFGGTYSGVAYDISSLNGTWMHIGAVWDRAGIAGSGDKLRLYINGNIAASSTVGGWGTTVGQQADIGGGNDGDIANRFAVDNLKVYDNAVTDFSGRFVEGVPEPSTAALGLLGGILMLRFRRLPPVTKGCRGAGPRRRTRTRTRKVWGGSSVAQSYGGQGGALGVPTGSRPISINLIACQSLTESVGSWHMANDALPEEWEILRGWLPEDLDARARQFRFFQRDRGLTDAERWLRLILMHVSGGLSLEQTALRGRELGLAEISGVALFKRLRNAETWLKNLCEHLLGEQQKRLGRCLWPSRYRVRAIDATDVQEPGSTGSDWRIHYSIRLPEMVCDHYEVTDMHGGESLGRFEFKKDELILADRGYSHWAGAAKVLDSGAALLMRWHTKAFPVQAIGGKRFELLEKLRHLPKHSAAEWKVQFLYAHKVYYLRLCAVRKSRVSAERAKRKAQVKARLDGRTASPESLELAEYILVLSSLPPEFTCSQVLELYRCRWQIELAFKRLKSLMGAGHVPKIDDQSARAWMQAKILTALLLERLLLEAKIFSPWGYYLPNIEPMASGARST